jgi:hypothetical protein
MDVSAAACFFFLRGFCRAVVNLQAAAHPRLASETSVCGAGHRKRTFQQLRASFFCAVLAGLCSGPEGRFSFPPAHWRRLNDSSRNCALAETKCAKNIGTYQMIKGTEYLFMPPREVVGKCPRCGGDVAELQKGFFCQNEGCKFAIWKNNKWWELKRKQPTKAIVTALLKNGRAHVSGL